MTESPETRIEYDQPEIFHAINAYRKAQENATAAVMRANMHQCESDYDAAEAAEDARDLAREALFAAIIAEIDAAHDRGYAAGLRQGRDEIADDVIRAIRARG